MANKREKEREREREREREVEQKVLYSLNAISNLIKIIIIN